MKKKQDKEYEIFKIKNKGKEKIVKIHSSSEKKPATKKEIKEENKILRNILIAVIILGLIFLSIYLAITSSKTFEYMGVAFEIEDYCDSGPCITFYKTSIPVKYRDGTTGKLIDADYNIRLRNNPKDLENVPVNGKIDFRQNMVLEVTTDNLFCDGDWNLAIGNLQKLNIFGINFLIKNNSEIYEPENEFMFIKIQPENTTSIIKTDNNNYNLNVNNCEILEVTEKLILEAFIKFNELN
ncbi:hypothetical protein CMI39_03540 [Candidatus Pacearchaeota archaeon]|jgi:hypothetical protein|nr:hypothetical protein [Candidatus Pacearchaeota archaeon]|tara:strand:- start:8632 stop:9348 length:717 start_codon:yes stop_codon:yes gene_type:complete